MRKAFYSAILLFLCASLVFHLSQQDQPETIVLDGVAWTEILYWDFMGGLYPDGWGWEEWDIIDGELEGRESEGEFSVYFLPFAHGGDFILETKFRFVEGLGSDVEVQLLTRDSNEINFESGMVLFAGERKATVRHMANKIDYVYTAFPINMSIEYGKWYVMRLVLHEGVVKVCLTSSSSLVRLQTF